MEKNTCLTKGETLAKLQKMKIENACILPLFYFTVRDFQADPEGIIQKILGNEWAKEKLIIRSSGQGEDSLDGSMAGQFDSVMNVSGQIELEQAISNVISSFASEGEKLNLEHQVLVQPQMKDPVMNGVAFSCDPSSGAPYIVINYSEDGSTDAVTAGLTNQLKVFFCSKRIDKNIQIPEHLQKVISLILELESLLKNDALDVEFALDQSGTLYLFQVRPLVLKSDRIDIDQHSKLLSYISDKVDKANTVHPYLSGDKVIYGVMPDWNPAEIIGIRPRPLALSLYRELITDSIWAYQRHNYGYKNLRSFPLLIDFFGLPYIDVRVSFNSFIPNKLDTEFSNKLVNYYLDELVDKPHLHDKVEFDIVISCYTFDFEERIEKLKGRDFSEEELEHLSVSLKDITNKIIRNENGLWKKDLEKIEELQLRQDKIFKSGLDDISKIYWLLEDCKRYGTLPFAGLARAGFIAVQMLQSLVNVGVMTEEDRVSFMEGLKTVSSDMTYDLKTLDKREFLEKYGHLRPGTYDILADRYDENPDYYLTWNTQENEELAKSPEFSLSLQQLKKIGNLLDSHGLDHDIIGLFDFLESGIIGREYSKFVFTKSLSNALTLLKSFGKKNGISVDDMSYAQISDIYNLYSGSDDPETVLRNSIENGKKKYWRSSKISLPPLISSGHDVWAYHQPSSQPNFVTQKYISAQCIEFGQADSYQDCIMMIPSADPGFDWIFSTGIVGFITEFGGVNSHMAIRASEMGIPAVIGAGTTLYSQWKQASILEIDCMNKRVVMVR